jgi:hypothetical protein
LCGPDWFAKVKDGSRRSIGRNVTSASRQAFTSRRTCSCPPRRTMRRLIMQSVNSGATQTRSPGGIAAPARMSGPQAETRVAATKAASIGAPVSFTSQKRFCACAMAGKTSQARTTSQVGMRGRPRRIPASPILLPPS